MAVASTYMIFPNDLMLNVNRVQRVFDDMSVSAVDDKLEETAAYDHQQRPSVSGTAVLQAQQGQAASTSPVSLSQQQTFNNNKKSLASRPFDLLRWFTPKSRRKEKEPTASTPSPVSAVVTAAGSINEDSRPYLDDDFTQERILDIDLTQQVMLPDNVDRNEWLATHTLSFFEHINLVYGSISEYCCQSSLCTSMIGPGNTQYHWIDERGKRAKCTAPQYVDYVMSFSHKLIYDETVFPTKYGNVFPATFEATVKKIHRLLLHVVAHVYQCHWQHLASPGYRLHGHVNTLTYHFLLFNKHFSLVEDKEMEVLDDLFDRLQYHSSSSQRLARKASQADGSLPGAAAKEYLSDKTAAEDNKENIVVGSDSRSVATTVVT